MNKTHTHTHTLKNVGRQKAHLLPTMSTNAQLSEWEKSRTGVTEEQETRGERERERGCSSLSEILGFICQHNDNKIIRFSSCRRQQQQQILFYYKSNKILV